jgi:hypothetical protein
MTNPSMNLSLEERVAALETAVAALRKQTPDPQIGWVEQYSGSFKDEPEFDAVLAYGRAIRQGDDSVLEPADEA